MQITLRELRETFAGRLAKQMDDGAVLWHDRRLTPYMPQSLASGKIFTGINALIFMLSSIENGYDDPRWTIQREAICLKRGEIGTFAEWWNKEGKDGLEFRAVLCFNARQLYSYPAMNESLSHPNFALARQILSALGLNSPRPVSDFEADGAVCLEESGRVFYAKDWHDRLKTAAEKVHDENQLLWNPDYFRHEKRLSLLRLDLSMSFLTLVLGMGTPEAGNFLPLDFWESAIRSDPSEIARAARDAQKLTNKVLTLGGSSNAG